MTLTECYEKLGGDYADVTSRLPSASLVENSSSAFWRTTAMKAFAAAWNRETGKKPSGRPIL